MKPVLTFVLTAWVVIGGAFASTALGQKPFISQEGGFSVQLPAAPTVADGDVGPGGRQRQYTVDRGDCAIVVSYQDNPGLANADATSLDNALKVGQNALEKAFQGKVIEQKAVKLNEKYAGREIAVTIPAAKGLCRGRLFLVRGRLYQLLVVGEPEAVQREAGPVFESFTLTK